MKKTKIIAYQYVLKPTFKNSGLVWKDESFVDSLFLGFPWREALNNYHKRARFYYGFSLSGHGEEVYPIIDAKVELSKPSLENPEFTFEAAVIPAKLGKEHYDNFIKLLESTVADKEFKVWWDDDPRGPRKRNAKVKKKLIVSIKAIKPYDGTDDLKLEDVEVSVVEALKLFNYPSDSKKPQVRSTYKQKFKELVLKHHPDSETGNESSFIYLEKCRSALEGWIKR